MRVTRLIGVLLLATALGMSFVLGPVTAGEHPWSEDPYDDRGDSNGSGFTSSTTSSDGTYNPDVTNLDLGSDLLWLTLIVEGADADGSGDATTEPGETATQ